LITLSSLEELPEVGDSKGKCPNPTPDEEIITPVIVEPKAPVIIVDYFEHDNYYDEAQILAMKKLLEEAFNKA
jgi:hypothetical protein